MILVTGGAGFIGSVLIHELNNNGYHDLIVVDRLKDTEKWLNLRDTKFNEYIHADDFFQPGMEPLHNKIDFIFHIGACSSTTERDMDFLMSNNVNYSKSLWAMALENNIPLVYASSAATYGDGELGYDDNHDQVPALKPLNPYGWSKQLFDQWVLKRPKSPPRWYGLKYFNVFGPNEYHKEDMRSLVHKGFEQIKATSKIRLFKSHKDGFENGEQLRDFIYVKDVCKAMLLMMDQTCTAESGIYNMGTGQERSFKDLAKATFAAMELKQNIEYFDMPETIRAQYQYFTKANMEKFHKNFPGLHFSSLEESVEDYVQNYLMKDNSYY
jgi:ADP-L-glycero-D-manno-heptose 6-epimerase